MVFKNKKALEEIKKWDKRFDELYDELHALKQRREEMDEEKFVEEYIKITDEIDIAICNKKELQRKIGVQEF